MTTSSPWVRWTDHGHAYRVAHDELLAAPLFTSGAPHYGAAYSVDRWAIEAGDVVELDALEIALRELGDPDLIRSATTETTHVRDAVHGGRHRTACGRQLRRPRIPNRRDGIVSCGTCDAILVGRVSEIVEPLLAQAAAEAAEHDADVEAAARRRAAQHADARRILR